MVHGSCPNRFIAVGSSRQPLYADGSFPDVAPDGRSLTFVHDDGTGASLRLGSVSGGDARDIVPVNTFTSIAGPRYAPDGTRIAFTARLDCDDDLLFAARPWRISLGSDG